MRKKPRKTRKGKRSRFQTAADSLEQLNEIEKAKVASSRKKLPVIIESVEKSRRRLMNALRNIKDAEDAFQEFE